MTDPLAVPTYRRTNQALSADVGDDVVALHVARGHCYGMEKVAADVWHLLAQPADLDGICRRLLQRYDVESDRCRSEVAALLDRLREEGLVEVIES